MRTVEVVNLSTGQTVGTRIWVADRPWWRLRGLLGRKDLAPDQGMLLVPCCNIHTFGMGFSIDVIYGYRDGTVCKMLTGFPPNRVGPLVLGRSFCSELPAGTIARKAIKVGHRLHWRDP